MATWRHELADPPDDPRERELWLQHAAGFILIEDVRRYASDRIDPALPEGARAAVQKGIDDALYGLMMVIDGVSGALANSRLRVQVAGVARLSSRDGSVLAELELGQGDGMCMGYHEWVAGEFGEALVATPRSKEQRP